MYKVSWGDSVFFAEEFFDDRSDAEHFANDRQMMGFKTSIVKV